ncbi:MAG TPA: substrate-binding domain-containing protein [Tepidisphaeraceae bacterium]|jgi:ribose transport system substrate-binding protein
MKRAFIFILLFLAGTVYSQDRRKITIGLVAKSQSNAVFQAAYAGAKDAAKELGDKYNADITIDWQTPTDEDAQKQAEAIDGLVLSGAQGIAVSCSEANTLTPAINRAVNAGIPVMCFDSDAPRSKRFCYYGTDSFTCGQTVMKELAHAMGEKGIVAILAGNQSAPNLQKRVDGVRAELKKHPGIQELNNGNGVFYHPETPEDAARAMQSAQTTNPQITGWALIGGWPLFTKGAIKTPPGQVTIVSVDALPAQLGYLEDGYVEALYAQDCYGWGHKSVEILLEKIINGKDPAQTNMIDPLTKVTKENVKEFAKNWDKWLGK